KDKEFSPALLKTIPSNTARMYRCVPVDNSNSALQVAFEDPLNPARIDEVGFIVKKEIQPVIANPAEIGKVIDKFYGQDDSDSVSEILKELGADADMAKEVEQVEATDDVTAMADLADAAPIVRFVNLVV